jgi:hypothetical protein
MVNQPGRRGALKTGHDVLSQQECVDVGVRVAIVGEQVEVRHGRALGKLQRLALA